MMQQLTLFNSPEVHEDWLLGIRSLLHKNYTTLEQFAEIHNIDYLSAFWFFKGNPVQEDIFKVICDALDLNYQEVQQRPLIKLLKLHCTYAGFIRITAKYKQPIKLTETRTTSNAIGKDYRGWVALAATHAPKKPNWTLIEKVAKLAAFTYGPAWLNRLNDPESYKPGHILALARVASVWQMTDQNITESELEYLVGGWEPGNWAIELENMIAPAHPIPYEIPGQGAIYLNADHYVYEEVTKLVCLGRYLNGRCAT